MEKRDLCDKNRSKLGIVINKEDDMGAIFCCNDNYTK